MRISGALRRRGERMAAMVGALGAMLTITAAAVAQDSQQIMIMDDGSGSPRVVRMTQPNFEALWAPQYQRSDLPIFYNTLELEIPQRLTVQTLLADYLASFNELIKESKSQGERDGGGRVVRRRGGPGGGPGAGPGPGGGMDSIIRDVLGEDGPNTVDLDMDGNGSVSISIGIGTGGGGDQGDDGVVTSSAGDDGDSDVLIAIDSGDGEELSAEDRAALEAKAQQIAQKVQQRLDEQRARGEGPFSPDSNPNAAMNERIRQMEEAAAKARALQQEKEALGERFLVDVQGQLEESQLEHWPRLERTLTRHKTLPQGRIDGESTDLTRVVDRLQLDEAAREAIGDSVEAYEIALHGALTRRNNYVADAQAQIDEAINYGDVDDAIDIVERASRLRVAVREINTQYADLIASTLAENTVKQFRDIVLQTSYPRVYRTTVGQKAFATAAKLSDVDAETTETIQLLAEAHQSELALRNQEIRRAIDRHMPKETVQAMERLAAVMSGDMGGAIRMGGTDPNGPIAEALAKRDLLDERYMNQLYGVLTPEQAAKLPRPPSADDRAPVIVETRSSDSDG